MILIWLIAILLVGGAAAWVFGRWSTAASRWIALAATIADFVITLIIWLRHYGQLSIVTQGNWLEQLDWDWIPRFGIHFHLALDGLSLLLLMLTFFLGGVPVLV